MSASRNLCSELEVDASDLGVKVLLEKFRQIGGVTGLVARWRKRPSSYDSCPEC